MDPQGVRESPAPCMGEDDSDRGERITVGPARRE